MRSLPFASAFALFAVFLAGCPDGGKGTETGPDDTGPVESGCEATDADGDGTNACDDCDDSDAMINPMAEESCDGVDNDCDGEFDEGVTSTYYEDVDGDGFGDSTSTSDACEPTDGWVAVDGDCNDEDPYVFPGAEEICDGLDNDCNDVRDDGLDTSTYYQDSDGDGLGNPDESIDACDQPEGFTDNADDCDDLNALEPVWADSVAGDPAGSGTMTNPLDTLQACIDQAESCCYAMPGTYDEDINFGGKNILVRGYDGTDSTYIVGTGETSVVTIASGETSDATLTGFTIMGGAGTVEMDSYTEEPDCYTTVTTTIYSYYGGGLYVFGADPSLYDLVVTDNTLPAYSYSNPSPEETVYVFSYGGGAFFGDATVDPWDVTFADNYGDNGGGAFVNSAASMDGKWLDFTGNWASAGGGLSIQGTASLNNSLLAGNGASSDGSVSGGGGVDVQGGTATLNHVSTNYNDGVADAYVSAGGELVLWNSILANNDSGYMIDGEVGTSVTATYSDVYGGASGEYSSAYTDPTGAFGNISADPEYTSATDLTLSAGSPAIGAGEGGVDMGAYGGTDGTWSE